MIGVEHFYFYNNNSTDDFQTVLRPFIEQGLVTLTDWPIKPGQIPAYKHWYENFRQECDWVSFLDLDEMFCPTLHYSLNQWLESYSKYPVIKIDWLMFGSSGIEVHDTSKMVMEQYTKCWGKKSNVGKLLPRLWCFWQIAYRKRSTIVRLPMKCSSAVMDYSKAKFS